MYKEKMVTGAMIATMLSASLVAAMEIDNVVSEDTNI